MRHLHYVQSLETLQGGGLGLAALELHRTLIRQGTASELVATCGGESRMESCVWEYARWGPEKAYFSWELVKAARERLGQTDIVHEHGFYVGTNAILGRAARKRGLPLVGHPQGFFDPWILRRSQVKKYVANRIFQAGNFRATRLWRALTGKEADQIRAQGFTAPIVVLPNGVHLPPEKEVGLATGLIPAKERPYRLTLLSRIHPKKGFDLLIPALARQEMKDWEVYVVGPDENGYLAEVQEMVRRHDLKGKVVFLPAVSGGAKAELFRSSDLFALPSYSEGFPVAVVEAASYGLPVVMTDECNFPELAAAGGAWICEPEVGALADTLRDALRAGPEERRQRGELGRQLIGLKYTWDQIARELARACDDLLSKA
ncbi:glycosyltransferase involved in cell wall biosynthesis [Prosthecobacter fusiformis]|uniref:Glycosyltransferase involved in cell wall biosynthesis n=1 Tax=Prosthecobacter fusiformis TaxID=48464 RepID=A0A4V6Q5E6_9BACT|nr:glycosyltransferase [Prosthecobacter fusiformis]TDU71423.1 glycosyltransferase involved in cell wall biosynthesis [Prosthecobacter fusiformis]